MKGIFTLLFFHLMISLQAQDWAQLEYYKTSNAALTAVECVFMGDSITEGWPAFVPNFFAGNKRIGRGIGGQTTPQMLLRFRQDVLALSPKRVVLLAGINDIAENTGPITLDQIMDNIKSMTTLTKANGIEMILCSVLPANHFPWRPEIDPTKKVIQLNAMIRQYAAEQNLRYVDYYTAMVDAKGGLQKQLGYDSVHPNKEGYKIMERVYLETLNQE